MSNKIKEFVKSPYYEHVTYGKFYKKLENEIHFSEDDFKSLYVELKVRESQLKNIVKILSLLIVFGVALPIIYLGLFAILTIFSSVIILFTWAIHVDKLANCQKKRMILHCYYMHNYGNSKLSDQLSLD